MRIQILILGFKGLLSSYDLQRNAISYALRMLSISTSSLKLV